MLRVGFVSRLKLVQLLTLLSLQQVATTTTTAINQPLIVTNSSFTTGSLTSENLNTPSPILNSSDESETFVDDTTWTTFTSSYTTTPTVTDDVRTSHHSSSKLLSSSTIISTHLTTVKELSTTEKVLTTTKSTTSSSPTTTSGTVDDKRTSPHPTTYMNLSCQSLKCEHAAECVFKENFVYCNCGWAYTGYNCHDALPLYLVIGLCASFLVIIIFAISSLLCFIKSQKKKIGPTYNGVHKEQLKSDTLFHVDESIYSDPTDYYSGEPDKGQPTTPMTVPKIPRIAVPKIDLDSWDASRDSTAGYQTFHPRKTNAQNRIH